jgi:hypothetical protein
MRVLAAFAIAFVLALAADAHAQTYPDKPIRWSCRSRRARAPTSSAA